MVLTVAQGQRHDGTADTGVRIDAGGGLGTDVVFSDLGAFHIEWFEISNWHDGFDGIEFASGSPMVSTAAYLLIHDFGDASGVGMRIGHDATVWNTIIYDGVGYGIRVATAVGTIQNCTIYGMSLNGVRGNIGSTVDIRNTISVGNALDDFDLRNLITHFGTNMFSTTNTFDPLAYQGYNKSPPSDLENLFISIVPGLEDLHLELTGHKAGNWCTTLSIDFTDDIDGETRSETFDMGADEAITGIATHNILTWQEVEP
jgi:hypothetical protein